MYQRLGKFERGFAETGIFEMTLATDGEASDGHILAIEGAAAFESIPLLVSHANDPMALLGRVSHARQELKSSPKRLRATGQIELEGDGMPAEIRRDLALMVEKGHLGAVSVRWEEMAPPRRRTELPKGHPARVEDDEPDARKRSGLFFEKWRPLEGSVVAIGADPYALIGRAEHGSEIARQFWRGMASEAGIALDDPLRPAHEEIKLERELKPVSAERFTALMKSEIEALENRIAAEQTKSIRKLFGNRGA